MLGYKLVKKEKIEELENAISSYEMFILANTEMTDSKGRCGTCAKRTEVEDKWKRYIKLFERVIRKTNEL